MTKSGAALRRVMRRWTTGVTLVTAHHDKQDHGMTVNSFTSISLDPPLILVALEAETRTQRLVRKSGCFAVSILAYNQQELAERFAGQIPEEGDRFAGSSWMRVKSGACVPFGCLAYLDCEVVGDYLLGTHHLIIGEAQVGKVLRNAAPLAYHYQAYRSIA
jgi:3-hydroxy-9,10-secoandrosta-1,3,5(10)-triene-9,17-dione monooxygenase reductase component